MTDDHYLQACLSAPITADLGRRTITGRLVPWGELGNTSAGPTMFAAGSVEVPDDPVRVKLLRDHDTTAPVGHAVALDDGTDGLYGTFRVPEGDDGDRALLEASDRLRDGLSVGVRLVDAERDDAGVLQVAASFLMEVSQVALPAFDNARTLAVVASATAPPLEGTPAMTTTDTTTAADDQAPADVAADTTPAVTAAAQVPPARRTAQPSLDLRGVAGLIAAANRNEIPMGELRAALSKSTTAEVAGIVPDAYTGELVGLIDPGRPTLNAIRGRNLPPAGMRVTYPAFEIDATDPDAPVTKSGKVDKQATQLTEIASGAFEIELKSADVLTYAGGNQMSLQATQRSDPSAIQALLEALAIHYGTVTNQAVVTALLATATDATGALDADAKVVDIFAALIGGLAPMSTPNGPLFASIAWDLVPTFIKTTDADRPAFWNGAVNFGSMTPTTSADGLTVVVDRSLPAGTALLGSSLGATWWENSAAPAEVRVVDVSTLAVDVALYGYGALTLEYPKAFAKVVIPAAAP
jgi:HK97 family phage prohead protease